MLSVSGSLLIAVESRHPRRRIAMRLDELPRSDKIEDRRGSGTGHPMGRAGGLGIGTIVILGLIGWALGIDPRVLIGGAEILSGGHHTQYPQPPAHQRTLTKPSDDIGRFVGLISSNVNREWTDIFQQDGRTYAKPILVLYHDHT